MSSACRGSRPCLSVMKIASAACSALPDVVVSLGGVWRSWARLARHTTRHRTARVRKWVVFRNSPTLPPDRALAPPHKKKWTPRISYARFLARSCRTQSSLRTAIRMSVPQSKTVQRILTKPLTLSVLLRFLKYDCTRTSHMSICLQGGPKT